MSTVSKQSMSQQAAVAPMNWFRQGVFAPVTEEVTAYDLPVTGRIPSELNGRYFRNGPNFMRGIDDNKHHWFLGSGMVHGVRLRDGRAEWYRNRWVRSKAVAEALGEKWREGPIHDRDFAANTHILAHAGRILATVEGGSLPYEISDELNTVGPYDFAGALPAGFVAHTKSDVQKGEVHAIAYSYRQDHVQHIIIDKAGRVSHITEIAVRDKPIMHDFALTEKYVVLYDLPSRSVLMRRKPGGSLTSGIRLMKRASDCFRAKTAHVERAGSPSSPALSFIRSMLTTMTTVFASTFAATQAVTMFR
jgi:carotenoid cleavage dioxygenase-like enzyme